MDSWLATRQDRISHVVNCCTLIVQHGLLAGAFLYIAKGAQYLFAAPFASLVLWEIYALGRFILRHRPWFPKPLAREIHVGEAPASPYR